MHGPMIHKIPLSGPYQLLDNQKYGSKSGQITQEGEILTRGHNTGPCWCFLYTRDSRRTHTFKTLSIYSCMLFWFAPSSPKYL